MVGCDHVQRSAAPNAIDSTKLTNTQKLQQDVFRAGDTNEVQTTEVCLLSSWEIWTKSERNTNAIWTRHERNTEAIQTQYRQHATMTEQAHNDIPTDNYGQLVENG